jgi:hypothetical protein
MAARALQETTWTAGHHLGRSETKHAQSMCTPHTILHPLEFADSSPV